MEKEVLEVVLKRSARESNIHRILEFEMDSALPKGENYTSTIIRIKMKVVLGNGRLAEKSLIMKRAKEGEVSVRLAKDYNYYDTEAMMYSVIFKEMEFLMEEFEDHDNPLWCKFISYDPKTLILLLEDLTAIGFRVVQRCIGLDLEHAVLGLTSLGRYHAMTKMLEERGIISKEDYKQYVLLYNSHYTKTFAYNGLKNTVEGIRKYWDSKWKNLADTLSVPWKLLLDKIKSSAKQEEGMFSCLNHGDCWSNNMMFKYNWQNRPVSVKFIDYQIPHYNTPCIDVTYFIYMSIQPTARRENYNLLLECYHGSLTRTLDKYGYTGTKPSLEDIKKVMERLSFFGLTLFGAIHPFFSCKSTEGLDLGKVFETDGNEGFNMEIFQEEEMSGRLISDLIALAEKLSYA